MVFAIALIAVSRSLMPSAGSGSRPDASMKATVRRDCEFPDPEPKEEFGSVWPVKGASEIRTTHATESR
jgi:hypothetical protein